MTPDPTPHLPPSEIERLFHSSELCTIDHQHDLDGGCAGCLIEDANNAWAKAGAAASRAADLERRVGELERALMPFANYADTMYHLDDEFFLFGEFCVGQFRQAARVMGEALHPGRAAGEEGKT